MRYELTGRIVFEADDVEDAFRRLALHFAALAKDEESDLPLIDTNVKIREVGVITPIPPPNKKKVTYRGQRK
jgi:hypothetical protein